MWKLGMAAARVEDANAEHPTLNIQRRTEEKDGQALACALAAGTPQPQIGLFFRLAIRMEEILDYEFWILD